MTIPLPPNSTSEGQRLIENAVSEELRSQFKVTAPNELAEHVMYFYPPGVMPGLASGQNPGFLTKFDDS